MKRYWLALMMMMFGSMTQAQPYAVTYLFGQSLFPSTFYSQSIDGSINSFTIDSPDFLMFTGADFDRPRDRVVLIAKETSAARLISINPSLNTASIIVLRSGLDVNAKKVHVDPETGRIYWWENDEILSVNADGTGTPIVEADNVPEPDDLDLDTSRSFYAVVSSGDLMLGSLDGVSSAPPTLIPRHMSGGGQVGVGINPVSGEIYWTEIYDAGGFTGAASAVYQVSHDTPLAEAQLILGSEDFFLGQVQQYRDVAVIGDQVVAASSTSLFTETRVTIMNTTTNQTVLVLNGGVIMGISLDFEVDPIIQHPVGTLVNQGDEAVIEVGPSDPLSTFQWFRNGNPIVDDGRITGTTTNKLVIFDTTLSDTNAYTCRVMASNGDQQTSNQAILAVRGSQEPECVPDINGDGELDFFDISSFIQQYSDGCP